MLIQDLLKMQTLNLIQKQDFPQTKKRALFLPHCCRKYMDARCQAVFDTNLSSYVCAHCSPDCSVNMAEHIAKEKGYDVYVLSGGSCMPNILKQKNYDGVRGRCVRSRSGNVRRKIEQHRHGLAICSAAKEWLCKHCF